MTNTVLLIHHQPVLRPERVSRGLARRGHVLDSRLPVEGDHLPRDLGRYRATVVYGGEQSANDDHAYLREEIDWIGRWLETGKPFLGICLGGQLLARALGARVARHPGGQYEIGYHRIEPTIEADGFLSAPLFAYQWHKEGFEIPAGTTCLARGEMFENQAYRYGDCVFGIQFHPEVTPDIMETWFASASHMLEYPGAHDAERQRADARRFTDGVDRWLDGFLDRWLKSGTDTRTAAG
jgi:GMP synthase (glutamine-hydrolysing)